MIDENKIYDAIQEIQIHLSAHTTILNESIKPDIREIKEHLVVSNGRLGKLETEVATEGVNVKARIDAISTNCATIQDAKVKAYKDALEKSKKRINIFMAVLAFGTLLLMGLGLWNQSLNRSMINYEQKKDSTDTRKLQVLHELDIKIDSILRMKPDSLHDFVKLEVPIKLRNNKGTVIECVSKEYFQNDSSKTK
jgi:hypothetical protein